MPNSFCPRLIEVALPIRETSDAKGQAQLGAIVLTGPELDKLQQLEDRAWLYIVTFCRPVLGKVEEGERPRLRIIQDPIPKLNPETLYRQVQFVVEEADWAGQGKEVQMGTVRLRL
jgi:hypothetical protein